MANPFTIEIRANRLPDLLARVPQIADRAVQATALRIEARAKTLAPVRTGYLRNSIKATKTGTGSAQVRVGAKYGAYVEFGTRHHAAQPFLTPAANAEQAGLVKALSDIEKELA